MLDETCRRESRCQQTLARDSMRSRPPCRFKYTSPNTSHNSHDWGRVNITHTRSLYYLPASCYRMSTPADIHIVSNTAVDSIRQYYTSTIRFSRSSRRARSAPMIKALSSYPSDWLSKQPENNRPTPLEGQQCTSVNIKFHMYSM